MGGQTYSKCRKSSIHKYDIKTRNCENRRVQMQEMGIAFGIKRSATTDHSVYIH